MRLEKILPKYSWLPLLAVFAVNMAVYSGTAITINDSARHYFNMDIDATVPFVPFFVVFYVLAFAHWVISWFFISREGKDVLHKYAKADIIAKIICLIVFIAYPTGIIRPEFEVKGLFTWGLNIIYSVDDGVNCLPSIHVLASWIAARAAFRLKKAPVQYKFVSAFLCLTCMLSVVFIKQHYIIDIPAGIIVAEIGLMLFARKGTANDRSI